MFIPKFALLALTTVFFTYQSVLAAPWIEPGDTRTRHHLQILVDSGEINTNLTTWPLMWSNVKGALDKVDARSLSAETLWSFQYLKHALRRAQRAASFSVNSYGSNELPQLTDFSQSAREQYSGALTANFTGKRTSLNIKASYHHDASDSHEARADGSYLTHLFGNWAMGIGAIDRWWGPGWDSSLILSHNARPTPGLFIQRNVAAPFETPWLSWLGPWQVTTFMNQFESDRATSNARLWGMRVSFRPLQSLELGLSRTAMWAGDGRPGDANTFIDLLLGRDNYEDPEQKQAVEPGNQLAGVDWRWGRSVAGMGSMAFYGQLIGEDEAGGAPSRHIGMAGLEISHYAWDMQHRLALETANTTVYFYDTPKLAPNVAYEHPLYPNGYRHYGRPVGAPIDNDGESVALMYQGYRSNGHHIKAKLASLKFNKDGGNGNHTPGNAFGATAQKILLAELSYALPLSDSSFVESGLSIQDEALTAYGDSSKTRLFLKIEKIW